MKGILLRSCQSVGIEGHLCSHSNLRDMDGWKRMVTSRPLHVSNSEGLGNTPERGCYLVGKKKGLTPNRFLFSNS